MNNEEAKLREAKLAQIKLEIAETEAHLTALWLELIDLRAKVAANHTLDPDHDYDPEE
jgi:predicted outer membrane lipoprotein